MFWGEPERGKGFRVGEIQNLTLLLDFAIALPSGQPMLDTNAPFAYNRSL